MILIYCSFIINGVDMIIKSE